MQRKRRLDRTIRINQRIHAVAEALEVRQLLSAASNLNLVAHPVDEPANPTSTLAGATASPTGFSVAQIDGAYGIGGISFKGVTGTGAGQTIAIIAAYDNPDLVDSTSSDFDSSDLHQFDLTMNLPDPPSFKKVDENGSATNFPPSTDPGWANEEDLDVEWTHAIAPDANILLVECYTANLSDLINSAVQYVVTVPDVTVVTMSFALNEFPGETADDSFLETPTGHKGITFLAASGDDADIVQYPSASPNVVSVGATALTLSGDNYVSETGSNSSGGGISQYESKPSYQYAVTQSSTMRTTPDVAIDGNEYTGLDVYCAFDGGSATPWYSVGGTSASTPMWAGLVAIADQGRATLGLGSLDGPSQTLPFLYSLNSSDFHDITTGSNGYSAGAGYDLVTGLGTPIANKLVPDLVGGNTVSGTVFNDANGNGTKNTGEAGLGGYTVFIDLYDSGVEQGADPSTVSTSNGSYEFTDLPGGTYRLSQPTPDGVTLTTATYRTVTLGFDTTTSGENIGFKSTGAAAQLAFSQQPSTVVVGSVITPAITVDVEDANGNIIRTDSSAVTLSISGGASLGGTLTVDAVEGVATFSNISVSSTGSLTLIASDGTLRSANSSSFTVTQSTTTPGTASQLAFEQEPTSTIVDAVITPPITVEVQDDDGNIVSTDDSAVTIAISSGSTGATLGGTLTVNAVNGIATFSDITVSAAGTVVLSATDGSLTSADSSSFSVAAAGVSSELAFAQQPSSATVGSIITPPITVEVEDSNGNPVDTDDSAVTLAIASGPAGATLGGTTTVDAVDGVATFSDITVSATGTVTLSATDAALTPATSSSFSIDPIVLVPTQLAFVQQPTAVLTNTAIAPPITVDVEDAAGAIVTTNTSPITLAIASGPTGATLGGTVTESAVDGVATFSDITISSAGSFTLTATDGSLTQTTSSTFAVSIPGTLVPTISSSHLPASVVAGSKVHDVVVVKESDDATAKATGTVTTDIYASANGALVVLGTATRRSTFLPNKSYSVPVPITTIPSTLDGTYSIVATVLDTNGNPKTSSAGPSISIGAPVIALSETVSKLILPAAVVAGAKTSTVADVKVTNSGNIASTGPTTIGIYASPDGLQSDATLIADITREIVIQPNHSAVVPVPLKQFPAGLDGAYTVLIQATDSIGDTSGYNTGSTVNISPATVSFTASTPIVTPSSITPGKSGTFTVTLENTGNIATSGAATITINLSTDGTSIQSQLTSLSRTVIIPAGKHTVLKLKFTIPSNIAAGSYFPLFTYSQDGASVQASAASISV
jgi:hypothetical protein